VFPNVAASATSSVATIGQPVRHMGPALGGAVPHVVGVGAEEQVLDVHACGGVAAVENAQSTGVSIGEQPRNPMRFVHAAIHFERAIAFVVQGREPEPTLV
jgi:hypothetical protein